MTAVTPMSGAGAAPQASRAPALSAEDVGAELTAMHTRLLQWCYLNAQAEQSYTEQSLKAEAQLFSAWKRLADTRKSYADTVARLQAEQHIVKLDSVLNLQQCEVSPLAGTAYAAEKGYSAITTALRATTHRLPISNVQGDMYALITTLRDAELALGDLCGGLTAEHPSLVHAASSLETLTESVNEIQQTAHHTSSLLEQESAVELEERSLSIHCMQMNDEMKIATGV